MSDASASPPLTALAITNHKKFPRKSQVWTLPWTFAWTSTSQRGVHDNTEPHTADT